MGASLAWTLGIAGAVALIVSYVVALRKIEQIHVLVNSRLSAALQEIRTLKKELGRPPDDP